MKNIHLIYYCNGEDYEDYDKYPVLAFASERKAQKVLAELTKWYKDARDNLPEVDLDAPNWEAQDEIRSRYIKSLKPPYDLTCLTDNIEYRKYASLSLNTLPLIK